MYKLCKTEQSALRQRELERGLLEVMSGMRYEDITVSDLCQKMNIPRKSFYRYFTSKDGALHALIDHTLMEFGASDTLSRGGKRTLQGDLSGFFQFWVQHKLLLEALGKSGLSGVLIERAIQYAISDDVFPRRFMSGESLQMGQRVVMFSVCGLMTMMLQWHTAGCLESISEMGAISARLLTQPLFPGADKLM